MEYYSLFDKKSGLFASLDPSENLYSLVKIGELKIWDVWDRNMIPFIENDPKIPDYLQVVKLTQKQIKNTGLIF